jgi:acyl-CoA hydrolase
MPRDRPRSVPGFTFTYTAAGPGDDGQMNLMDYCPEKVLTAQDAVKKIKNGSRVFIGTGCGEPQELIRAMVDNKAIQDIIVYQMLSSTFANYIDDDEFFNRFSLKLFFISLYMRQAAFEGKIDYVPVYLSQIPQLFASKEIGLDIALIQISPPDRFGFASLGISVTSPCPGCRTPKSSSPR